MWEQRPRAIRQHRPPRPCRHRRRRRTRGTASSTRGERVIREAMAMASGLAAPRDPWLGPEPPDLACPAGMHRVRDTRTSWGLGLYAGSALLVSSLLGVR